MGPRGPHMRALGHSLEQAGLELRREMDSIAVGPAPDDPGLGAARADVMRWRDDLTALAEAFVRLGAIARSYPC